jgi:AAHS family benzoate transporter-like MFS transporter
MQSTTTPNGLTVAQWSDRLSFNRFHALVMALAGMILVFDGYDAQIIAYVMPQLIKEWHLSPLVAGSMASYGFVGLMIGAAAFGTCADRIGRKKGLMIALTIFSVFSGAAYWAPNFQVFCILRFLAGVGMGGAMPLTITLVTEFAPAKIRGKAVSTMFAGFTLGWAVAALVAMIVIPLLGWRMVLLFGFLPVLCLPVLKASLPESVRFLAAKGRYDDAILEVRQMEKAAGLPPAEWTRESFQMSSGQPHGSLAQLFTSKLAFMTVLLWATYFLNLLVVYGLATWLPSLLVKAGFSLVKSYSFGMIQAMGATAGGFFLGWMMDRFGRKSALVFAYLAGGIVIALFGMVSSNALLYLVGAATGVFVIGAQIAQHVVTGELYPTNVRSTGVGWALTAGRFGSIAGPLLGGALQMAGFSFTEYFLVFAIPSFLCAGLVLLYRVNVKNEGLETVHEKLTSAESPRAQQVEAEPSHAG